MRKAQRTLAGNVDTDSAESTSFPASAAGVAQKENRLTFAWLDGEAQKVGWCFYHFSLYFVVSASLTVVKVLN